MELHALTGSYTALCLIVKNTAGLPLVAQMVKNRPAMQETRVRLLGLEYPLEKGIATHYIILAWSLQWATEPVRLLSMGVAKSPT